MSWGRRPIWSDPLDRKHEPEGLLPDPNENYEDGYPTWADFVIFAAIVGGGAAGVIGLLWFLFASLT